ncbi:HlyD family type I secretion periplasmic adaptor subunit [Enterobacter sp. A103]|uniref:HlyD family type I secretion periplasmic adaptor subunit n=1 Tax=Enterobacter sp. A103 TaxID=3102785 RepID=UPI002ACB009B|nr:HlyD family type I secretion periplasmic adaptor subunit [Enterobacter sp. A103]MDZ5641682.1 HlyD family type I secretion periplasmic adaptor subunit [Enterobacter sp. A103]
MNISSALDVMRKYINKWFRLTAVKRTRDEYEFQPGYLEIIERPPAPLARSIALGLTCTLLLILIWAILGHLDIQANATGQLLVSSHSKVIQSLESGEVISINVHDGQRVKAGDILIRLNPVSVKADLKEQQAQLRYQRLEQARLQALLSDSPVDSFVAPDDIPAAEIDETREHLLSVWRENRSAIAAIDNDIHVNQANQQARRSDITSLEKLIANIQVRLAARRKLLVTHVVSKEELLEHEKEELDTARSIEQQRAELRVLEAQQQSLLEQKKGYMAKFRRENYDALTKTHNEIDVLTQQLIKAQERERIQDLRSPVDGVVQQQTIHTLGGVVQPAQQLMIIVPEHTPLEAEVMVMNKDVGFVREGQSVEVKVDAFPYTRYGTLHGVVAHVSKDAVKDEKLGLIFPAQVRMTQSSIKVGSQSVPLQAGMSLTAEIRTGDRRVIDYLLSPLQQYQSESLRER